MSASADTQLAGAAARPATWLDTLRHYRHLTLELAISQFKLRYTQSVLGYFWSLLKRGLRGTYISVEPFHLDAYVKEQVFRYNNRKDADDFARFATCMMGIQGKRLTYKALTQRPGVV